MANALQRYSVHLANGTSVLIRPVLPQDKEMQQAFVRYLSDEARYFRFMTGLTEMPDAMADYFTRIDHYSHVAVIGEVGTPAGSMMIAEARYVVDQNAPDACEFAVAVADSWQGMSLAYTMLLRLADHALSSGIRRMIGDTVATNQPMLRLAKRCGFRIRHKKEDGRLISLVWDLRPRERYGQASNVFACA